MRTLRFLEKKARPQTLRERTFRLGTARPGDGDDEDAEVATGADCAVSFVAMSSYFAHRGKERHESQSSPLGLPLVPRSKELMCVSIRRARRVEERARTRTES